MVRQPIRSVALALGMTGLLALTGCATAERSSEPFRGATGPVTWEVTDIGQLVSSDGQRARWSYIIVLKETAGSAIKFTRLERASYTSGMEMIGGTPQSRPYERTLASNSEIRYSTSESWGWVRSSGRTEFGGVATIQPLTVEYRFIGSGSGGGDVNVLVRLRLDRGVGRVVTPVATAGALPPAAVIEGDLAGLSGVWRGSYHVDGDDFDVPFQVTIRPDGSIEAATNEPITSRLRGTVRVQDGKLAYSQGDDRGQLTLHDADGKRYLAGYVTGPRGGQGGVAPFTSRYAVRLQWQSR